MKNLFQLVTFFLIMTVSPSCIERFYVHSSEDDFEGKIVIEGYLTDDRDTQEVVVSSSTTPEYPHFSPKNNCSVEIWDDLGNKYLLMPSEEDGHYRGVVSKSAMKQGTKFSLKVVTASGEEYRSNWEKLSPCPEIDSVYYHLQTVQTMGEGNSEEGLQFYLDFQSREAYGDFYLWKLEETYEYHSQWAITRYLDYHGYHLGETDSSFFVCYKTETLGDIFTLSTRGLSKKSYKKYPLHFVNDHTQRLMYQYSLLVKQYSISEDAYYYWESLRKNNQEAGGLFEEQPAVVRSNIHNIADSSEAVLGYFGVSSVKTKRITILDLPHFSFDQIDQCEPVPLEAGVPIPTKPRPLYFTLTKDSHFNLVWGFAPSECFICTLKGGTTEKPTFFE